METELPTINHLIKALQDNNPCLTEQIISACPQLVNERFYMESVADYVTPLHCAQKECAKVLLKHNADIHLDTILKKETALDFIFLKHEYFDSRLARFLIASGANINHISVYGDSLLHLTINQKFAPHNFARVKFLLKHGARIEMRNNRGQSPLDVAIVRYKHNQKSFEEIETLFENAGTLFFYKKKNPLYDPYKLLQNDARLFRTNRHVNFPDQQDEKTNMECILAKLFMFVHKWDAKHQSGFELEIPSLCGVVTNRYGYCFIKPIYDDLYEWVGQETVKRVEKHFNDRCTKAYKLLKVDPQLFLKIVSLYPYIVNYDHPERDKMFGYMMRTMKKSKHSAFIASILEYIRDLSFTNERRQNLLILAFFKKNPLFIKLLMQEKIDFTETFIYGLNKYGNECMDSFYKALAKRLRLVNKDSSSAPKIKHFLSEYCDLQRKDVNGNTLLSLLCKSKALDNSHSWSKVLFALNATANVKNNKGKSPLAIAVDNKRRAIIKVLLEHGAIVTSTIIGKAKTAFIKNMLQTTYDEQTCLVCYEHPEALGEIPCDNKHHGNFLCQDCYNAITVCPFRCGKLHDFNAM